MTKSTVDEKEPRTAPGWTAAEIDALNARFRDRSAAEVVARVVAELHPEVALACSFSMEDVAILAMMTDARPDARVFALDTGRLNEETYDAAERVRDRFGVRIEWHFPDREAVEALARTKGLYSFRQSLGNRHECCRIRKVEPLSRALAGLHGWITGQRREQAVTRAELALFEIDEGHGGILKINPLAGWSDAEVREYVRRRGLPYNRLHDAGYPSIGCAPCTRSVAPGEDPRAGRWWWERPEHKECGLHGGNRGASARREKEE